MTNCWKCSSTRPPIVSERSRKEYCPDCFYARDGSGYLTAMNEVEVIEVPVEEQEKIK